MPLSAALDRATAWYAERDQPALVQLPHPVGEDPSASELGSLLVARDWRFFVRTLVMTKTTSTVAGHGPVRIDASDAPTDDWWLTASPRSLEHRGTLTRVLARIPAAAYLTAYLDGRPVGHARLAFTDGWSGVFDLWTDPAARRRGVSRTLMDAADRTAHEQRIPSQYLQVAAQNETAAGLYRSLGWRVHHEYHYATPMSDGRNHS